jgi:hypothetical protein
MKTRQCNRSAPSQPDLAPFDRLTSELKASAHDFKFKTQKNEKSWIYDVYSVRKHLLKRLKSSLKRSCDGPTRRHEDRKSTLYRTAGRAEKRATFQK